MHWMNEEDKKALADFRADMRQERQLRKELLEFKQIAHNPLDHRQFVWALQMIKSIEHELHELLN